MQIRYTLVTRHLCDGLEMRQVWRGSACNELYTSNAILNFILSGTWSQCKQKSASVMWSCHRKLKMCLAAALNTDCR